MDDIIKKRTQLINFFKKEDNTYTKLDILNKEFSVLQFSLREEFIDNFITPYDYLVTDIDDIDTDVEEVYIKGIIVDIDNKKDYSIIHIQNKDNNVSITCDKVVAQYYGNYFELGNVIIAKCHTYQGKFYMHLMINFSYENKFIREANYMSGKSASYLRQFAPNRDWGLVKQSKYFTSKNGNKCLRLVLSIHDKEHVYITCSNKYNTIPTNIIAGKVVQFKKSNSDTFVNDVREVEI